MYELLGKLKWVQLSTYNRFRMLAGKASKIKTLEKTLFEIELFICIKMDLVLKCWGGTGVAL